MLQKRTTAMSQLSADQTQGNEPLDGDTSNKPNASQHTNNTTATDFGIFNGKVQDEVGRFQNAIETANDAVCNLAKTFHQHGEMVQIVGERWERYQKLEEELREQRAAAREMWRYREEEARRVKELEEDAHAGEKEKLHYHSLSTHLKDEYTKKEQRMKQKFEEEARQAQEEFENKKMQLEADNAEKIAALERQKMELENANTKLKQDLDGREKELEVERESNKRLQESLRQDIGRLKGKLNDIHAKYAVEEQSLEY
jgi:DNA repair exonuclease SbcCD ATPase subunit